MAGFFDLGFSLIPWLIVKDLQMKRKEKLGMGIAMSLGVFAAVTAAIKCMWLPVLKHNDFSYVLPNLQMWAGVESGVTIIAASIPMLRVYFRDLQPRIKTSLRQRRTVGTSGTERSSRGNMTTGASGNMNTDKYVRMGSAGGSREAIIPKQGVIVQTEEVDVDLEGISGGDTFEGEVRESSFELRKLSK
ncbi:hypothetical protein MKZ38_005287 [Zalerion maritima]|uniref:Rhodopsin domain-containing protein n=1 Tax=Zalerion maritima TaxID=339359 RepID=A0AAD5RR58_9PEZI|nr:hypothetical protein MKZ38_005287 [Zalerion maritima]